MAKLSKQSILTDLESLGPVLAAMAPENTHGPIAASWHDCLNIQTISISGGKRICVNVTLKPTAHYVAVNLVTGEITPFK